MRDLTTAFKTAVAAGEVRVGMLCELDYPTTPLRAWTGIGDLVWDSKTWQGTGDFGTISAIQEKAGPTAGNVTLTVSGVPASLRAIALANTNSSRTARVWLAVFAEDEAGLWSVISDPWKAFQGKTDIHTLGAGQITVNVETALARVRMSRIYRYTDQDQRRHFPNDTAGRYGASVNQEPFYWGSNAPHAAPQVAYQ